MPGVLVPSPSKFPSLRSWIVQDPFSSRSGEQPVARLDLQPVVVPLQDVRVVPQVAGIPEELVRELAVLVAGFRVRQHRRPRRQVLVVLHEAAGAAPDVGRLEIAPRPERGAARQRELLGDRRVEPLVGEDVLCREAAQDREVVVRIEAGAVERGRVRQARALVRRAGVDTQQQARVADVRVLGELRLAVLPGVLAVGRLNRVAGRCPTESRTTRPGAGRWPACRRS